MLSRKVLVPCLAYLCLPSFGTAAQAMLNFRDAAVVLPSNPNARERKAASMLSEEIEKRTQLRPKIVTSRPAEGSAFLIGRSDHLRSLPAGLGAPSDIKKSE